MKRDELKERMLGQIMNECGCDTKIYLKSDVNATIAELKQKLAEEREFGLNRAKSADHEIGKMCVEIKELKAENRKLKRALWVARAAAAKFWANYWFDVAPLEHIKYDRIGRMEGVEKEFILTKVTKHMAASDWVAFWEKVERRCSKKAEEYK